MCFAPCMFAGMFAKHPFQMDGGGKNNAAIWSNPGFSRLKSVVFGINDLRPTKNRYFFRNYPSLYTKLFTPHSDITFPMVRMLLNVPGVFVLYTRPKTRWRRHKASLGRSVLL